MAYRNKTYVAFASEDISYYRLMQAWKEHDHIDFDFFDAHDLNTARDSSQDDSIKRKLHERLLNTKQVVLLISDDTKTKAAKSDSFIHYEVEAIVRLGLPVVFANLNGSRDIQTAKLPTSLLDQYTISVSFQPKIIQFALDNYNAVFEENRTAVNPRTGPHYYKTSIYTDLGL